MKFSYLKPGYPAGILSYPHAAHACPPRDPCATAWASAATPVLCGHILIPCYFAQPHPLPGCVSALASLSTESTLALSTPLTRLRMLALLQEAWDTRWAPHSLTHPSRSPSPALGSPGVRAQELTSPLFLFADSPGTLASLAGQKQGIATQRTEGMQLLSVLRCAALQAIGHEEGLADALTLAARQHRQANAVAAGLSDISRLTRLLNTAAAPAPPAPAPPMEGSLQSRLQQLPGWAQRLLRADAPWRLEEARLMWHLGQKQAAARRAHQLAAAMLTAGQGQGVNGQPAAASVPATVPLGGGSTGSGQALASAAPMQLAEALSLAGHWAAEAQLLELGALGGQQPQVPGVTAGGVITGSTSTSNTSSGAGVLALLSQAAQIVSEHAIVRPGRARLEMMCLP
jgi:hypothetical protein